MGRQPPRLESERIPSPVPARWVEAIEAKLQAGQLAHQQVEGVLVWLRYDLQRLPPNSSYETDPEGWFSHWLSCIEAAYLMRENPLALILGSPERPAPMASLVYLNLRRYIPTRLQTPDVLAELEKDFAAYLWERSVRWDPERGNVGAYLHQLVREFCSDYRRREDRQRLRFPRLANLPKSPVAPATSSYSSDLLEELRRRLELGLRLINTGRADYEVLLRLFARAPLSESQLNALRPCRGTKRDCPIACCREASEPYRSLNDKELYQLFGFCQTCHQTNGSPEALQRRVNYQANRLLRLINTPPKDFPTIDIKGLRELLADFFA